MTDTPPKLAIGMKVQWNGDTTTYQGEWIAIVGGPFHCDHCKDWKWWCLDNGIVHALHESQLTRSPIQ